MGITVRPQMGLTIDEVLDLPAAPNTTVSHKFFNLGSVQLKDSTTPPATKHYTAEVTLDGSGDATIDLTSFAGTVATEDGSNLKVQGFLFHNPAGNSTLTISPGASNPYPLFGTDKDIDVPAGGRVMAYFPEALADVSGTVKTIDLAGGNDETINVTMVLG